MMNRFPERLRTPLITAAALVIAVGGTACKAEQHTQAATIPGCKSTPESIKDAQALRPDQKGAVQQALDIYKTQTKDRGAPYSTQSKLYKDLLRVPVPGNKEIDVQILSKKPHPTVDSLIGINSTLIDTKSLAWYMTATVVHDDKEGWRLSGSYLTEYKNSNDYNVAHLDATPGVSACAYETKFAKDTISGTYATMEHRPADAQSIGNEIVGRVLVAFGAQQHVTPGAAEYDLPPVTPDIWKDSHTPIPDQLVRVTQPDVRPTIIAA